MLLAKKNLCERIESKDEAQIQSPKNDGSDNIKIYKLSTRMFKNWSWYLEIFN